MKIHNYTAIAALALMMGVVPSLEAQRYQQAMAPADSKKTFQLHPDFDVELVVSEPDVLSPIDIVFDENSNVYVIEMGDYPYDAKPGNFKGRIRLLKDTDGDGKLDHSYVFAENLPSATSILPWKGGVLVTAAPDILYLKDTDGDHQADHREVLFTGFFNSNSEAQITSLRFGIDNWIYANNFGQAGLIRFNRRPDQPLLQVAGGDFRFRLDLGLFESESGTGQFGLALDDWGHRFYNQNTLHIQQSPIAWRYAHRHAYMPSYRADVNISDHELEMYQVSATPYWREQRSNRRQAKHDSLKTGFHEYAREHFTAATGVTFYGGDAFPDEYYGTLFSGDVAGNLVHRDILTTKPGQPSYVASRHDTERQGEFLTATDMWFRPANFYSGPDGYLYLVDMYRQHIETPVSIPEDLKEDMDFSMGEQYGRIWRIFPKGTEKRALQYPNLTELPSEKLVGLLAHPNRWYRLTAQRLLLERADASLIPQLKSIYNTSTQARERLHVLYVLDGLKAIEVEMVKSALQDAEPGLREHGLILAERYDTLLPDIFTLTNDPSPQVAYQAVLSTGQFTGKKIQAVMADILSKHVENASYRMAVLSSAEGSSPELLESLENQEGFFTKLTEGKKRFMADFGYITGSRNEKGEIQHLIRFLANAQVDLQVEGLNGLAQGIKRSKNRTRPSKSELKSLQKLDDGGSAERSRAIAGVEKIWLN